MTARSRALAVISVGFALGFPAIPIERFYDAFADIPHLVGYELIWWAAVALLVAYVRLAEGMPFTSIGVRRPSIRDVGIAAVAAVAILAGLAAIYYAVLPAVGADEQQQLMMLQMMPAWWIAGSVVRAAVAEELLFRGYAIERLTSLTGSRALAGVVTCAIFTVEHVGEWGWGHLLVAGFGGAALTLLYLWRRNLWVNIIAHLLVDLIAIFTG